jgi:hypothetical protein
MLAESVVHSAVGLILASTTEDRDDVVAASQAPNTVPLDLIVNGVWAPVVNHLAEKFPNMFSVGIAETFYTAYTAVEGFTSALSGLLEVEGGATREALGLAERLKTHSALLAFHAKWKLDLYYQLRSNEISARFEKGLQTLLLPNGMDRGSTESVYGASGETLSKADISHLQSMLDIERFQLVASRVLLTELATCLHKNVMLPAQASRFLGLVVQLLLKLQGVIATIVNGTAISSLGVGNVTAPSLSAVTPAKAVSSVASTPALSANTAAPIASQALSFSNEDLLALTADLEKIGDWIETFFVPHCEQMLPYRQVVTKASPVTFKYSRLHLDEIYCINFITNRYRDCSLLKPQE